MSVTHEDLAKGIAVLQERSDNRDHALVALRNDVTGLKEGLAAGSRQFTKLGENISTIRDDVKSMTAAINRLVEAENQRIGREGVWAAIMRSNAFAWVMAALATVGAFFVGGKQ